MKEFLHHLLLPRESNNHKAKVLHHSSLLLFIVFLFTLQIALNFGQTNFASVLGEAINISTQELVDLTNQKRQEQGLPPLVINEELSKAALEKAKHMFANNYWAHTSDDGTTPWFFIKNSGYGYVYAGENLARGFTNTTGVVNAWMESPSHRENMLSSNYRDIGFAVLQGKLLGEETTLVVEMFGSSSNEAIASAPVEPEVAEVPTQEIAAAEPAPATNSQLNSQQSLAFASVPSNSVQANPLINLNFLTKNLTLSILSLFLFVLVVDIVLIERRKIVRSFTHNIDHLIFFGIFFVMVLLLSKGIVL